MREEELIALVRKIQRRQTEFQTVELKAAHVDFPKSSCGFHQILLWILANPHVDFSESSA